ncbi:MAG: hypothetical protein EOM26_05530, partial [Alphaproteobacteria bacterium]|nr:hypothetical protein [Alphaproteobacteria bacterium]
MSDRKSDLAELRSCAAVIEGIFFAANEPGTLDHERLNVQLDSYDHEYDRMVRRREFNLVYLMHELLIAVDEDPGDLLASLSDLEAACLSSSIYRDLIFGRSVASVREKI